MTNKIFEASEIPQQEKIFLKKDIFNQWIVVYPIKNEDGKINWFNLITGGNKFSFWVSTIFILIMLLASFEYHKNLAYCSEMLKTILKV